MDAYKYFLNKVHIFFYIIKDTQQNILCKKIEEKEHHISLKIWFYFFILYLYKVVLAILNGNKKT